MRSVLVPIVCCPQPCPCLPRAVDIWAHHSRSRPLTSEDAGLCCHFLFTGYVTASLCTALVTWAPGSRGHASAEGHVRPAKL
uniref:Uncharacterized protein n=1 Tax=Monodon monoceros TaxID=40151 RepID=A0A8C6B629_MONMO